MNAGTIPLRRGGMLREAVEIRFGLQRKYKRVTRRSTLQNRDEGAASTMEVRSFMTSDSVRKRIQRKILIRLDFQWRVRFRYGEVKEISHEFGFPIESLIQVRN
jgi:hypothetical protein